MRMSADGRIFRSPGFIVVLTGALYFAQGLPLGVAFSAYPAILREAGASLSTLAWLPMLGLPWMLKFLWSPFVDNHWLASLGRRRTWLLSQQVLMIGTMLASAAVPMTLAQAPVHFTLFALASFFSATQDIATDGLAAERLQGGDLLRANALAVTGMILGMLVGGGGVLILADWLGTQWSLIVIATVLLVCAIPALLWREDAVAKSAERTRASLVAVRRSGFSAVLTVALLFAAGHSAQAALAKVLLVDRHWTLAQIGWLETTGYVAMLVLGCGAGSWAVARLGSWTCLALAQALLVCTSAAWLMITFGWLLPDNAIVTTIRILASAGMGMASVAAFTIMMLFAGDGRQTGTDVTVFKSANVLGEIVFASLATAIAAKAGYTPAFILSAAAALLALGVAVFGNKAKAVRLGNDPSASPTPIPLLPEKSQT
jgi:RhtX/FptX family siderophore transporter